jgi:hypothetical protein
MKYLAAGKGPSLVLETGVKSTLRCEKLHITACKSANKPDLSENEAIPLIHSSVVLTTFVCYTFLLHVA